MAFTTFEESIEGGRKVVLYHFLIGTTNYRYTSAGDEIVFQANTFFPRQITGSAPSRAVDENPVDLEINIPATDAVVLPFIGTVPGQRMAVTIYEVHRDDLVNAHILWQGRIAGASFTENGTKAVMRAITSESAASRPVPRHKYQSLCNHFLYDANCTLDRELFKFTGTITAIVGNVITIGGLFAAEGADWALGGYIKQSGGEDYRMVLNQSGDDLTVLLAFADNLLGSTVDVYAGCLRDIGTCETKFNNKVNHGGWPNIPTKNIFQRGLG